MTFAERKIMPIEDLTERQRMMIDAAADDVFTSQLEQFYKYIADVLRPFREIRDSSVRHAVRSALLRYGRR
jgi:hypothetical protein